MYLKLVINGCIGTSLLMTKSELVSIVLVQVDLTLSPVRLPYGGLKESLHEKIHKKSNCAINLIYMPKHS